MPNFNFMGCVMDDVVRIDVKFLGLMERDNGTLWSL